MVIANAIVLLLGVYAAAGLVFAAAFVIAGIGRIDQVANGSSIGFRLIVLPGAAALWPLLLRRWLNAREEESS
jgi:hypothetical protein